jgi:hypothetical protein
MITKAPKTSITLILVIFGIVDKTKTTAVAFNATTGEYI